MKAIIEAQANFPGGIGDDETDVEIQVIGAPDEELEPGAVALVHPKCTLILNLSELQSALRMFERRGYERR